MRRSDIVQVLTFFGERYTYGLRSIELLSPPSDRIIGMRRSLGRLVVPGRIMLYAQPPSPWSLPGTLRDVDALLLESAGAEIDVTDRGIHTVVHWPGDTLRHFMLFDVLMHEIGHHLIQHYTGKRSARVARTRDHEAFARRFAHHCRLTFLKHGQWDL